MNLKYFSVIYHYRLPSPPTTEQNKIFANKIRLIPLNILGISFGMQIAVAFLKSPQNNQEIVGALTNPHLNPIVTTTK